MLGRILISEDTVKMAREAKKDQGNHEMEVSFCGEGDLRTSFLTCEKNPGHAEFIPVNDFGFEHLPRCWGEEVAKFMRLKFQETVRLTCTHTSQARPEGYTFSHYKNSKMMRSGSGRVWAVELDKTRDIPCPFPDCVLASGPHMVYGPFRVHTALHVVFDDSEARHTKVDFFYDSPEDLTNKKVVSARGVSVERGDIEGDFCVIECVTHDPTLCARLDKCRREWMPMWMDLRDTIQDKDIAVAVSHPHGMSKHVTIGPLIEREHGARDGTQGWFRYRHKAPTCPGCSGAPVWVPGNAELKPGYAPHSGCLGDGMNLSAVWFWW